jgi:hypothetical protein
MPNIAEETAKAKAVYHDAFGVEQPTEAAKHKFASVGNELILTTLREAGLTRAILPEKPVTIADFDHHKDEHRPYIVIEREAATPAPRAVNFEGGTESWVVENQRVHLTFFDIHTKQLYANAKVLSIYKNNPLDYFTANSVKDIATIEDYYTFATVDDAVGSPGAPSPAGKRQNFVIDVPPTHEMAWSRVYVNKALTSMKKLRVPAGVAVVNASTYQMTAGFLRSEVGGDLSQEMFTDGVEAIKGKKLLGQKWIQTIKDELIPDNTMYLFPEPQFMGYLGAWVNPTLYTNRYIDTIKTQVRETIGIVFANTAGLVKVHFTLNNAEDPILPGFPNPPSPIA